MPENSQQLETPHSPAGTDSSLSPLDLCFRVPAAFQAYLVRRKQLIWLCALGIVVLMTVSFYWPHPSKHHPGLTFYLEFLSYTMLHLAWREQRNKPWYYEFAPLDAKLISLGKTDWAWHHLKWRENPYVGIERQSWNGLPMLIFTRRTAYFWEPKKLLLVYSPEDEDRIEQIVPFMAKRATLVSEGAWYQKS